jgi:outer membrane protein TolC
MKRIILIVGLALNVIAAFAADSIDALVTKSVSNNSELKSLELSMKSEELSLKSENDLAAPEVEVSHQWGYKGVGNKLGVVVSQSFDWPGAYSARKNALKASGVAMNYLYNSTLLEKLIQTKLTMIDIIYANQQLDVLNEMHKNIEELSNKTNEGYSRGELTILDVKKLNIEKINISRKINAVKNQLSVFKAQLCELTGLNDVSGIVSQLSQFEMSIPQSEAYYEDLIEKFDPTLASTYAQIDLNQQQLKVEKMKRLPGFSLGYMFNREQGETFNGFAVGLSLPFLTKKTKLRSTEALSEALQADVDAKRIAILSNMRADRAQAVSLCKEIHDFDEIFANDDVVPLLNKALKGGVITIIDYICELNYFMEAKLNYIEMQYQLTCKMAQLNKLELLEASL